MKKHVVSLSLSLLALTTHVSAADLFSIDGSVNGTSAYVGANNLTQLINLLTQTNGIQSYLPTYTDTSAANLNANFRGLPISFSYAANSTTLNMYDPATLLRT